MAYRVELSPEADQEIDDAYHWLAEAAPAGAHRWYNGLMDALRSLCDNPQRCRLAPENDAFEEEIRQLLYGRRKHRYRVLFTMHEHTVRILHVRHGARRHLTQEPEHEDE